MQRALLVFPSNGLAIRRYLLWMALSLTASAQAVTYVVNDSGNPLIGTSGERFMVTATPVLGSTELILDNDLETPGSFDVTTDQFRFRAIDGQIFAEFAVVLNEPGNNNMVRMEAFSLVDQSTGNSLYDLGVDATSGDNNTVEFNEVSDDPLTAASGDDVTFNTGGDTVELAIFIPVSVFANVTAGSTIQISHAFDASTLRAGSDSFGISAGDGTVYNFQTIPEPSAVLLCFLACLSVLVRRRSS